MQSRRDIDDSGRVDPGSMLRWLINSILALACVGCVVVPIGMFTESPYREEVLQKLRPKNADRNLVRRTLGSPKATKSGGRYWFYAHSRETWGAIAGSASPVFTADEWLAVAFYDSGLISFIESSAAPDKCLSNGICHQYGLFTTEPSKMVATAPTQLDIEAKAAASRTDACTVYLFLDSLPFLYRHGSVKYSVDGQALGLIDEKTYLFLTHPPGAINISAYQLRTSLMCDAGAKLYVKAVKAKDWSMETGQDLSPVNATAGEAAIRARRLALPD